MLSGRCPAFCILPQQRGMIMIKVKHPLEQYRQSQEAFLANCPLEERRYHELLFSYGNSSYRYHQDTQDYTPTETDYQEWL